MPRSAAATLCVLVLTLACSSRPTASDDGQTTTTQGATESGKPSEAGTSTTEPSGTAETDESEETEEEGGFVRNEDLPSVCSLDALSLCDEFAQDCPDGEKCVPHFDACAHPICVPITDDKPAGSPCTVDESGGDDCDANSWCYPGTLDPELPAICISFCQGTADNSSCPDPSQVCMADRLVYDSYIGCRPSCDPLLPEGCEAWERCTVVVVDEPFGCVMAGGVADGEVCGTNQDCDSGACVDAEQLLECAGERCCAPWCDLMAPTNCAMGLECVPFDVGDPNSNVGVCALP